jgi:hypothetical protein
VDPASLAKHGAPEATAVTICASCTRTASSISDTTPCEDGAAPPAHPAIPTNQYAAPNWIASQPVSSASTVGSQRGCDRRSAPKQPYAAPAVPSMAATLSPAIVSPSDER